MTFLKNLLKKVVGKQSKDDDQIDHYEQLEKLRANHDWINVKVTKTDKTYQSLILSIDIENNELLIDDLYPSEQLNDIDTGDTVEIISQTRHKSINFYTRILNKEFADGSPLWRLELPSEIGRNHNRGAYRLYVENETDLSIEIYADKIALSTVHIINLSIEGIKLSFNIENEKHVQQKTFTGCVIHLPNNIDIDCDIILSNHYVIHRPSPHILSGGELILNNAQHRVKLQQYLAGLQRKQRRRESRTV